MTKLFVGICGGSGSGKTLFLKQLLHFFPENQLSLLSMDNYYKPIDQQPKDENGIENFDLPESLDREKFYSDLIRLKNGENISLPEYTFNNSNSPEKIIQINAAPIIVVEGIFTFYFKEISDLLDLKIYIEAPDYLMLTRRITRDAAERGYDLNDVLYRFQHHVTPSFKRFIEPIKNDADLIIPNHDGFSKALDIVSAYFGRVLQQ